MVIGYYQGKIKIKDNEVEVFACAYQNHIQIGYKDGMPEYMGGLKEWSGKGALEYGIAKKLMLESIKTEIGEIMINYCSEDNKIQFIGMGEPNFKTCQ